MTALRKATLKNMNLLDNLISKHGGNLEELIRVERGILNALSVPVYFIDVSGRFLGANRTFYDFLGTGDREEFRDGVYLRLARRFASEYEEIDRRLVAKGGGESFEGYACDKNTTECPVIYRKTAIRGENDEPTGLMTTFFDLSELKDVRKALVKSEAQKQAILDGFPDIVVLVDRNLRIVWANNSVSKIGTALIGRSCREVFCGNVGDCEACGLKKSFGSGHAETWMQRLGPQGTLETETYFEMISTPVTLKQEKIESVVVIARDATEKLRLEKQLRHAMKMEAIGTLAGGIAHDFNNVLTPIMGYSEIIRLHMQQEGEGKKEIIGYIESILKAARRAKRLVEQILTFSRSSEQKESLQYIHPIVKEVMKLIRTTLPSTIEIRQQIDEHCGMVLVDPVQIHQILINLCANAAYAMSGTSGVLTVRLAKSARRKHDLEWLELSVTDTGCGIDPAIRERIFEPYFTTKEKGQGTGMGLAMVHGIISRQGGELEVESEVGQGATFRILLPISQETTSFEQIVSTEDLAGGGERILLIDDEEQVVAVTGELLESLGYKVTGKTSAPESLLLFSKSSDEFDLVVTDLTMPFLTGLELCKKMKGIRPNIPVILFTGYREEFSSDAAKGAGVDAFVMKPVSFKEMARIVRKTLDRRV
jgi:signal transduction histidine kinase/CheY-like chemotaxis protein/PAS domain-containing protein